MYVEWLFSCHCIVHVVCPSSSLVFQKYCFYEVKWNQDSVLLMKKSKHKNETRQKQHIWVASPPKSHIFDSPLTTKNETLRQKR